MLIESLLAYHFLTGAILHGPPFEIRESVVTNNNEYRCLIRAVWHESRGEGFEGRLWTAKTILNRTRSIKFPPSVCKVVYQKSQFSFTHQLPRSKQLVNPQTELEKRTFREVEFSSTMAIWMDRLGVDFTSNSKYYHNLNVKPIWRHNLQRVKQVGNHVFYKEVI